MAIEMDDLMALKGLCRENCGCNHYGYDYDRGRGSMTPYEQFKTQNLQARSHTSGVSIAGLVLGTVGTAAAIGAWIFAPLYSNAKAGQAKEMAIAAKEQSAILSAGNQRQLDQLTTLFAAERNERISGDIRVTQTVNQQSSLTAQQQAELSAVNSVMQQTYSDFVTGRASLNPQPVALYSAPQPCPCPGSCGCNG